MIPDHHFSRDLVTRLYLTMVAVVTLESMGVVGTPPLVEKATMLFVLE